MASSSGLSYVFSDFDAHGCINLGDEASALVDSAEDSRDVHHLSDDGSTVWFQADEVFALGVTPSVGVRKSGCISGGLSPTFQVFFLWKNDVFGLVSLISGRNALYLLRTKGECVAHQVFAQLFQLRKHAEAYITFLPVWETFCVRSRSVDGGVCPIYVLKQSVVVKEEDFAMLGNLLHNHNDGRVVLYEMGYLDWSISRVQSWNLMFRLIKLRWASSCLLICKLGDLCVEGSSSGFEDTLLKQLQNGYIQLEAKDMICVGGMDVSGLDGVDSLMVRWKTLSTLVEEMVDSACVKGICIDGIKEFLKDGLELVQINQSLIAEESQLLGVLTPRNDGKCGAEGMLSGLIEVTNAGIKGARILETLILEHQVCTWFVSPGHSLLQRFARGNVYHVVALYNVNVEETVAKQLDKLGVELHPSLVIVRGVGICQDNGSKVFNGFTMRAFTSYDGLKVSNARYEDCVGKVGLLVDINGIALIWINRNSFEFRCSPWWNLFKSKMRCLNVANRIVCGWGLPGQGWQRHCNCHESWPTRWDYHDSWLAEKLLKFLLLVLSRRCKFKVLLLVSCRPRGNNGFTWRAETSMIDEEAHVLQSMLQWKVTCHHARNGTRLMVYFGFLKFKFRLLHC